MLVLPNMDPTHRIRGQPSLQRALLLHLINITMRLSIFVVKVTGTALAMFLVPRLIHVLVCSLDDLYEMIGRRAVSPWETQSSSGHGVLVGLVAMAVMHHLLSRIGYGAIFNKDLSDSKKPGARKEEGLTWEKVLMRVIIPVLLYGGLCATAWSLWQRSGKREFIRANTVDVADDAAAELVWRDR